MESTKVPIETLRNGLRSTQLVVERELAAIQQQFSLGKLTRAQTLEKLKLVLLRAQKIQTQCEIAESIYNARKSYQGDLLPVLIGEYLLQSQYFEAAREVSKTLGLDQLLDFDIYKEYHEICGQISRQNSIPVLQWAQKNRQYLRKVNSTLEFEAKCQHFIQLAGKNKLQAIEYSRKNLGKFYDSHYAALSSATLALLGPSGPVNGWQELERKFSKVFLDFHGKTSNVSLFNAVTTGLCALRTHNCSPERPPLSRYTNHSLRDHMCPACSPDLGILAKSLPFAHHTESILDSDIVVLPNKRCYGRDLLLKLSSDAGLDPGKVFDPATLEVFDEQDLRKAFPS